MPSWAAWVGVLFAVFVLWNLLRAGALLFRNLRGQPQVEDSGAEIPRDDPLRVTVVIPCKDEEARIERSVRSIVSSDYPFFELVVVDDRSTDRTREIVENLAREDPRITVMSITELPAGWTGKTHALYEGTKRASGDILLFTDGDTELAQDAMSRTLAFFSANDLDMLSLFPGFTHRGFSEHVIYPHLALGLVYFYPLTEVNDQNSSVGLASGTFIMLSRTAYEDVGTWRELRNEITEDIALAVAVKARGRKLMALSSNDLVRTREFANVAEVCQFWKRTFYGAFGKRVGSLFRLAASYAALALLFVLMISCAMLYAAGKGTVPTNVLLVLSAAAMAAVIVPFSVFLHNQNGHWAYGLTAPLGIAVSVWVTLSTLVALLADKGIRWRGSLYR